MKSIGIWKQKREQVKVDTMLHPAYSKEEQQEACILYCSPSITVIATPLRTFIMEGNHPHTVLEGRMYACVEADTMLLLFGVDECERYLLWQYSEREVNQVETRGYAPLRKEITVVHYLQGKIYLGGVKDIHPFEIASPLWQYHLHTRQWKEIPWGGQARDGWILSMGERVLVLEPQQLNIWTHGANPSLISTITLPSSPTPASPAYCTHQQTFYFLTPHNILLQITSNFIRRLDFGIILEHPPNSKPRHLSYNNNYLHLQEQLCVKSAQVEWKSYWIKPTELQELNFMDENIPLHRYYKVKQYDDMVFLVEGREVHCYRELFQFYSPKFRKLYSNSSNKGKSKNSNPTMVKLDNAKFPTVYFLVEQLYHHCQLPINTIDAQTVLDLMILAHKFQIQQLQILCETQIQPNVQIFPRLYDYYRNAELPSLKDQILKLFVIHSQQLMKTMPIGKVQQLIRLIYTPECQHHSTLELKSKVQKNYQVKTCEHEYVEHQKHINYAGLVKNEEIHVKICQKCHKVLGMMDHHRKNKSLNRESFGIPHRKRENNSG